jgi:RNA polymerase sigma factor (sigma-70 family)
MIGMTHPQRRTSVLGDAELVSAAQRGDARSLGILLERHQAPLYGLALNILGCGPEAQDAVQDTFLVALSSIDRLREPEAVGGWLHSILRNLCYTRLRKARGEVPLDKPAARLGREPSELSAEETVDRLALREWVWTALSKLPEALRVTAMLRYFGAYSSYEEISAILGVPIGTVGSRLGQVKVKLANALLETAGLAHDEARRLTEFQARYFEAATEELNRGQGYDMLASSFSPNVVWAFSDGSVHRGRAFLGMFFEEDLEHGIKMHLTNVIASKDVTVMEGDFENPLDDPFHCPPATSMVYFYRDGRIHRVHQHYALRPEQGQPDRGRRATPLPK